MEVSVELKNRYLRNRREDLVRCFAALEVRGFFYLEKFGHQLKGSASTFGMPELSVFGTKLENSSRKMDVAKVQETLNEISILLQVGTH